MIFIDLETTGTDPRRNCMLSLGAIDHDTGEEFYGECSVYPDSYLDPAALAINGFTLEEIQNPEKQLPEGLYLQFRDWAIHQGQRELILAGHNVGHFDILFLEVLHGQLPLSFGGALGKFPFSYRTVDLHTLAFAILGKSLSHENICRELGLPVEPKPHHALEGARSERNAFMLLSRMLSDYKGAHRQLERNKADAVRVLGPKLAALQETRWTRDNSDAEA